MADPSFSTGDGIILLGRIVGLYGVKGWVKIYSHTRQRGDILQYTPWLIRRPGQLQDQAQAWKECAVAEGRMQGLGVIARLEGYNDRDQATCLVGADIGLYKKQLPSLAKGEFYWAQLEGLRVVTLAGIDLGRVSHLIETGANDVLVVRPEGAGSPGIAAGNPANQRVNDKDAPDERLIPYIQSVIKEVDLAAGVIRVDWDADF